MRKGDRGVPVVAPRQSVACLHPRVGNAAFLLMEAEAHHQRSASKLNTMDLITVEALKEPMAVALALGITGKAITIVLLGAASPRRTKRLFIYLLVRGRTFFGFSSYLAS